jgi:hypothetical protein
MMETKVQTKDAGKHHLIHTIANDERLSFVARGLWLYLLSIAPHRKVMLEALYASSDDGPQIMSAALYELEACGAIVLADDGSIRLQNPPTEEGA